ncbi:MAG: polymer-forming cytoskeletal protein [Elusimicrobiota bacterium]
MFSKSSDRKYDGGDVVTIIGPEAYFQGVLTVRGSLRIEGEVEGNIHEAHTVILGGKGRIKGDVCAERVVVGGHVVGDVVAKTQLELIAGGRITGDIRTPKLLIEEGAAFEGRCSMGGDVEPEAVAEADAEQAAAPEDPDEGQAAAGANGAEESSAATQSRRSESS